MKTDKFAEIIEELSPLELQESWDNSGFQIKFDREINRVLVAMEITKAVVDEAIACNADIIVTHHPMLFTPIRQVDDNNVIGNYIVNLIRNNISVYASHTPFDKCAGGNNDYLAKLFHLCDVKLMDEDSEGYCRTGIVDGECRIDEYIEQICSWLNLDKRFVSFTGDLSHEVKKVGLCTGAGADFAEAAAAAGCDLFVTGDVKYHGAQTAKEMGLNLLDIGHYGSEKIFVQNMFEYLKKNTDIEIIKSTEDINPFVAI